VENDGFPTQLQANFQILNPDNRPIKYASGSGDACALTVDRTFTNARTTGGAPQTATR
jgi:hypothetical protein